MSIDSGGTGDGQPRAFDWGLGGDSAPTTTGTPGIPDASGVPATVALTRRRRERARTTPLGWAALVFAIIVPPLGFVLSLIARSLSLRRYRRTTSALNAALTISIVLSVLVAAGGGVAYAISLASADEAKIVAESKPFCDSLDATPGILDQQGYGWPTEVKALPETLDDMKAYQQRWQKLADLAPKGIATEVDSIAAAATTIVGEVESTKTINRQQNVDSMNLVTSATTTIPTWVAKYCK
jgi:hypothetical protein